MPGQFPGVRVVVKGGVAFLSGSVDFLWQKRGVQDMVSVIPCARSVVVKNLNVAPSDVPDSRIRKSIMRLLKTSRDIDESTMSVAVRRGFVTLAGTARDRRELSRIAELLGGIMGIRGTENCVVVSSKQKEKDRSVAKYSAPQVRDQPGTGKRRRKTAAVTMKLVLFLWGAVLSGLKR